MKRLKITAVVLAFALVIGASIAPAGAYFTDSHNADGGLPITVEPPTDIKEWYATSTKHIVITNSSQAKVNVFVRARIDHDSELGVDVSGQGWTSTADDGGWYYYDEPVAPGKETKELTAKITFPKLVSETQPPRSMYGDSHSAIVIYETLPATYDEDGNVLEPDWSAASESNQSEEGGN